MKQNIKFYVLIATILLNSDLYGQKIANYFYCSTELGNIVLEKKLKKKALKKIGKYKIHKHLNRFERKPYKFKSINFNDTLEIVTSKKYWFSIRYYIEDIEISFPSKIQTKKGIQIGKSNREDVLAAYGKPDMEAPYDYDYYYPDHRRLTFVFYEKKETDEDYDPKLAGKVVSIILM